MKDIIVGSLVKLHSPNDDDNIWIVVGTKDFSRSTGESKLMAVKVRCMTDRPSNVRATRAKEFWHPVRYCEAIA
jgi:hypothetical protein|tara:strand:+ start:330 stop:551 length:222 start_codon:yes stop_codon:yes gene_type:complete